MIKKVSISKGNVEINKNLHPQISKMLVNSSCFVTRVQKRYKTQTNFQPEKLLKSILNVIRIILMLYYTEKLTELIESPTTICIHLENLPSGFCIFSEKCDKVHLLKTTKYSEFFLSNVVDCSHTIFRNTRLIPESIFSHSRLKYPTKWAGGMIKTKTLAKRQIWRPASWIKPEVDVCYCIRHFHVLLTSASCFLKLSLSTTTTSATHPTSANNWNT